MSDLGSEGQGQGAPRDDAVIEAGEASGEAQAGQGGAKPSRAGGMLRGVGEFLIAFAIMIAIIFGLRTFVMEPFTIPSGSMIPTIEKGDSLYAEKLSINGSDFMPTVGQVYTFINPADASETLIKRVIATEGQTVDLRDGQVYVDGVALDEPYTHGQQSWPMQANATARANGFDGTFPYTIPEGCFWAMGDNRGNSSDSRVFGPVEASAVTGHAVFRYWPVVRTLDPVTVDFGVWKLTFDPFVINLGPLAYTA